MAPPGKRDLVRYREVRRADVLDDQKSAADILAAEVTSLTQEQLQEYVLSQVKRIIFGERTGNWNEDFLATGYGSLADLSPVLDVDCLATDALGDFVYLTGVPVGGYYQVTKVDYTDPTTIPAVGILRSKSTVTRGIVQTSGIFVSSGIIVNNPYWIGANGQLAATPPVRIPGTVVYAQPVGIGLSSTEILLRLPPVRYGLRF